MKRLGLGLCVFVASAAVVWRLAPRAPSAPPPGERLVLDKNPPASPPPPFARALEPRVFRWPEDHGPHFDYETEWWYATGNLRSRGGRPFGYQVTIFRRGLTPGRPPEAGLQTNQVYFAHFAVTDIARGAHAFSERWSRGAPGLAGSGAAPLRVFLEEWSMEAVEAERPSFRVRARDDGSALDLVLSSQKTPVLEGDRGLSAKGRAPGNASYYVTLSRLATSGTVSVPGETFSVEGESWLDHEWSTSALPPDSPGWDWFGLQLDDGRELMFFRIRGKDRAEDTLSSGTLVSASGATHRLLPGDIRLKSLETWTSPRSGARYPSKWSLELPLERLSLTVEPSVPDQELRASFTYWEGSVQVQGLSRGLPVSGRGYVELTGYLSGMAGVF